VLSSEEVWFCNRVRQTHTRWFSNGQQQILLLVSGNIMVGRAKSECIIWPIRYSLTFIDWSVSTVCVADVAKVEFAY